MSVQHVNSKLSELEKSLPINVADTFLVNPAFVVIPAPKTFVAIGGVSWQSDFLRQYTVDTAGKLNYSGPFARDVLIIAAATMEKVGGGADLMQLAVAIDGVERTKTVAGTQNKDPTSLTSLGIFRITTGQTIQAFVANDTTATNILVSTCAVSVISAAVDGTDIV